VTGECDEVAAAMVDGYYAWLEHTARLNTLVAVRAFVDRQMPDEGMTLRDNVTTRLRERTKSRMANLDATGDSAISEAGIARPKFGRLGAR
jgi:hypothetical protein